MKILSIARKTLLELLREPLLSGLLLVFPPLLVILYAVAFGQTGGGLATYLNVLVLNQDAGASGAALCAAIRESAYAGQAVLAATEVQDRNAAEIVLREHKAALLLVIPADFSAALASGGANPAAITLVGDAGADMYVFAKSILDDIVQQFARAAAGQPLPAPVTYEFLPGTGTMSDFDYGVPGMIVFGTMFVTIATAMILVRERVKRTLLRLRLTRANSRDILLGITMAQLALATIQVPITFGVALLTGFDNHGAWLPAAVVVWLLTFSAVGLGLITACFAHNDGEAANLGAVVGVLMSLASGALYPAPPAPLAVIAGHEVQAYDFFPPALAAQALRQVLVIGEGWSAITYELVGLAILAALLLAVGVALYQKLQIGVGTLER
ncbi:MAG: ABC transporter permease [Anaerolineae bacterium]|nr:ABC transporter permease [Anaerolineae bacterium]